jgi:hypothetical protein
VRSVLMNFRFRRCLVDHDEIIEHFSDRRDDFGRSATTYTVRTL